MNRPVINKCILVWLMLFIMSGNDAQVAEVKTWLDSSMIKIGEQVKLHVEVRKNIQAQVNISEFREILPGTMEIIGEPYNDTMKNQDGEIITRIYTVTSFDSGVQLIPPIPVSFVYQDLKDTIYSNPLDLNVYYPEVDTSQVIKDIKPPIKAPFIFSELIPYLGIILGAILLAAVFVYLYLRYRKKKKSVIVKKEELVPAHVTAFKELDGLRDEKLWQSGKVKEFYSRLSDIIRKYLESRYNFRSMECVTDEIINDFGKVNQDTDVDEMLSELLHTSDMVKFAKGDPLPAENQSILNNAYFIVEKTKLVEMKSLEEMAKENAGDDNSIQKQVV